MSMQDRPGWSRWSMAQATEGVIWNGGQL